MFVRAPLLPLRFGSCVLLHFALDFVSGLFYAYAALLNNKGASGGSPVGGAGFGVLRLWLTTTGSGGTGASAGTTTCAAIDAQTVAEEEMPRPLVLTGAKNRQGGAPGGAHP